MIARSISGEFCDDIRTELGGKISYMGCYRNFMDVPSFPITLPKLCIHVRLITPIDDPFKAVKFVVLRDEEEIAVGEMPEAAFAAMERLDDEPTMQQIFADFIFSPLNLEGPCTLRVRAHTDTGEIRGLGIAIRDGQGPPLEP